MSALEAKEVLKADPNKNFKIVPKKKKIDFLAENKKYLKGRPKKPLEFGLIETKTLDKKPSAGVLSPPPLMSPRASISSNPKKKIAKKQPKESELDRHLREAQEEEARFRAAELERQRLIDQEKAKIAAEALRQKEKELKAYEKKLQRERQQQELHNEEMRRLEREALER